MKKNMLKIIINYYMGNGGKMGDKILKTSKRPRDHMMF